MHLITDNHFSLYLSSFVQKSHFMKIFTERMDQPFYNINIKKDWKAFMFYTAGIAENQTSNGFRILQ